MPQRVGITTPLLRVWLLALPVGLYSCLALVKSIPPFSYLPAIPVVLDAALTFAMALLIAFRINRAYERWWEARSLWGRLVNVSRNLAIKILVLHHPNLDDRRLARNLIVAFCRGLKDHLRDDANLARLPGFESDPARPAHMPSHIVTKVYGLLERWQREGTLSDEQLWVLDSEARMLLEVCGGCEKIKTTLMPVSWRFLTWQCITLYLIVLPWALVDDFQAWTILISVVVAYVFIAGEAVAHYVEEPFGVHEDHLNLDLICEGIDRSVSEVLVGSAEKPAVSPLP